MQPGFALYYPYIHFRDVSWLKTALLLWDKVCRIVPRDFPIRDSGEIAQLADFVYNLDPAAVTQRIGEEFQSFLVQNERKLSKYSVEGLSDDELGFLYHSKIRYGMAEHLNRKHLAKLNRGGDPDWIGLHPSIAAVYMSALANELAIRNQLEAVTFDDRAFCALGGVPECAKALLNLGPTGRVRSPNLPRSSRSLPTRNMLMCLFSGFEISNADDIPADKLIKFITKYRNEKVAFRYYVEQLRLTVQQLANIEDEKLRAEAQKEFLANQKDTIVADYRRQLRDAGIETIFKLIAFRLPVGTVLTSWSNSPILGIIAGTAAVGEKLYDYQKSKAQIRRAHPAATYLLELEKLRGRSKLQARLKRHFSRNSSGASIITLNLNDADD